MTDICDLLYSRDDGLIDCAILSHGHVCSVFHTGIHLSLYICSQVTTLGACPNLLYDLNEIAWLPGLFERRDRGALQARRPQRSQRTRTLSEMS